MKQLEQVREQLTALQLQLSDPVTAGASRQEVRASVEALVVAAIERAEERVRADLQRLAAGADADLLLSDPEYANPIGNAEDARAWLVFAMGRDAMLARFSPLLDELPEGLTPEQRAKRYTEIQAEIVRLEVREEALIREAEADGHIVDPRPGQRPEAAILIGYGA